SDAKDLMPRDQSSRMLVYIEGDDGVGILVCHKHPVAGQNREKPRCSSRCRPMTDEIEAAAIANGKARDGVAAAIGSIDKRPSSEIRISDARLFAVKLSGREDRI